MSIEKLRPPTQIAVTFRHQDRGSHYRVKIHTRSDFAPTVGDSLGNKQCSWQKEGGFSPLRHHPFKEVGDSLGKGMTVSLSSGG
jgi:hypothetical protein